MSPNPGNIYFGVDGGVSRAVTGTTAPTDHSTALPVAWKDIGAIAIEGVTISLPDGGDVETLRYWQNEGIIRSKRSPSDDLPTISFTALEKRKVVLETFFDTTATAAGGSGIQMDYKVDLRTKWAYVFDVIDGSDTVRYWIPQGYVSEVGDLVYSNEEPVGYEITIEMEYSPSDDLNFRLFSPALASS